MDRLILSKCICHKISQGETTSHAIMVDHMEPVSSTFLYCYPLRQNRTIVYLQLEEVFNKAVPAFFIK